MRVQRSMGKTVAQFSNCPVGHAQHLVCLRKATAVHPTPCSGTGDPKEQAYDGKPYPGAAREFAEPL